MKPRPPSRSPDRVAPDPRFAGLWRSLSIAIAVFTIVVRGLVPHGAPASGPTIARAAAHGHAVITALKSDDRTAHRPVGSAHEPAAIALPFVLPSAWELAPAKASGEVLWVVAEARTTGFDRPLPKTARGPPAA